MAEQLGCSTISFRRLPLARALDQIMKLGFGEVDLGGLPDVCHHVPVPLAADEVTALATTVRATGLRVRALNLDSGPMNRPDAPTADLSPLIEFGRAVEATAMVLPAGAADRSPAADLASDLGRLAERLHNAHQGCAEAGLDLLVEAPHHHRLVHDFDRTAALVEALDGTDVGMVLDVSHVVAGGGDPVEAARTMGHRLRHVHLRDATEGDIHRSLGRGQADFPGLLRALAADGYQGHFSLELETHDVTDAERPAEAARAGRWITDLLTDLAQEDTWPQG